MHEGRLVVDGLVFFSDGDAGDLLAGGVDAVNLTVSEVDADFARAVDDINTWHSRLAAPGSPWHPVRTTADIEAAARLGKVGLIMGWQNARPIDEDAGRLALFHALGLRVVQLTYNHANYLGDGCLEPRDGGLTELGRRAIAEMNRLGITVDVSHCGERTSFEAALASTRPIVASHASAKAVSNRVRNKSDATIRAIAERGGAIGVSIHGFMNWSGDPAMPPSLELYVAHVRHVADVAGWEAISFGTDFAAVATPAAVQGILDMSRDRQKGATAQYIAAFGNTLARRYPVDLDNPRHLRRLGEALAGAGVSAAAIEGILGRNLLRVFDATWTS